MDSKRIMRLRTNKVLKFFALLLFSLEVLAPAMLVDIAETCGNQDQTQIVDGTRPQNILYSIFTEELTENEEGREGHRDVTLLTDFNFDSNFFRLCVGEPSLHKYSSYISQQFETQPPLFKLNCTFLI